MTGSSLYIRKADGLTLISISPGEWWDRQGRYAELSLKYTLILMLASITVLSGWLYFISSVIFKACCVWICLTHIRHRRASLCPLPFQNECLTYALFGACPPLLSHFTVFPRAPETVSLPSFIWPMGPPRVHLPSSCNCRLLSFLCTSLAELDINNFIIISLHIPVETWSSMT